MKSIPSVIRVGPLNYKVMRAAHVTTRNRWGETDNNLREMRFGSDTDPQRMSITVLHEIMHAVWNVYGSDEFFKVNDPEEEVICSMAMGLSQVLVDLGLWPSEMKLEGE
jgi:hypothetical protein